MYMCEHCQKQIAGNVPSKLITVATRQKTYPVRRDAKGKPFDLGGTGYEIVREVRVCGECYAALGADPGG